MAPTSLLARGWTFEINTGTTEVPVWTRVKGINTWSHSPTDNDADSTDFDSAGNPEHQKASHADEYTLVGQYKEDVGDGSRDPGQAAVEALAAQYGPDSIGDFRITSPGGNSTRFDATANVTVGGGGNDDNASWECTWRKSGVAAATSVGSVPAAPTSVTGTGDDTFVIVDWTAPASGSPFTMYEVVAYDESTEVVDVQSDSKPVLVPGLTNGTEYTFKVRAANAEGWGPLSAASAGVTPSGS